MEFWIVVLFNETFLEQSIWICKWVNWWSYRLTIFHVFCVYNFENFNFLFAQTCKSMSPYQNISEQTLFCIVLFRVNIRQVLLSHSWNMGFSSFLWTKYMENCEAMTSSTHTCLHPPACIHTNCSATITISRTASRPYEPRRAIFAKWNWTRLSRQLQGIRDLTGRQSENFKRVQNTFATCNALSESYVTSAKVTGISLATPWQRALGSKQIHLLGPLRLLEVASCLHAAVQRRPTIEQ